MAESRTERKTRRRRQAWRFINLGIGATVVLAAAVGGVAWGAYVSIASALPRPDRLDLIEPSEGSEVLSSDGVVLARVAEEHREVVPLAEIPQSLQWATLAAEDASFYQHHGVSPRGIARAAYENLRGGRFVQGGSTITQQLARNVFLSQRKTIARKLQEMMLALQLERRYTKNEILGMYLNQICYGSGAWGVRVAAETYFGKALEDISLGEAAVLAGLPKRPAAYSPFDHPKQALGRRDYIVGRMEALDYISADQAQRAKEEELKLAPRGPARGVSEFRAPYFVNHVLREAVATYGDPLVYRGGLRIHTTLNWKMQQVGERVVREQVQHRRWRGRKVSEGALVALSPWTGAIKTMVGGIDYQANQYNCVTQAKRQAGSAFKPFVYTAAIDNGWTPESIIVDEPVTYGEGRYEWSPKNYDGKYRGPTPLRSGLKHSVNVVAVKLSHDVGLERVIDYAHHMGIKQPLKPYHSLALGIFGVTPMEMATAFGTIAAGGIRVEPYAIEKVTNRRGDAIWEHSVESAQVLSADTAETMQTMLRDVIMGGTGSRARIKWYACGKTGTTSDYKDAWFIGFTDDVVCAVWVGNRDNTPMKRIFGASIPAPIWKLFMTEAVPIFRKESGGTHESAMASRDTQGRAPSTFTRKICADSGLLAQPQCPNVTERTYTDGQPPVPPQEKCTVHGPMPDRGGEAPTRGGIPLSVCAESGKLGTENCTHLILRTFRPEDAPSQPCPLHPPSDSRATESR